MTQNIVCIRCPLGCRLEVELNGSEVLDVNGNECLRGVDYAKVECTAPTRTLTTTVGITGGDIRRLPVRTRGDIPKSKIIDCIEALRGLTVSAPVNMGDVILADAADTGIDIIATRRVAAQR